MKKGSKRYQGLVARLAELRKHLLAFLPAPPVSKISYSSRELDFTRAYVLLVHAEIEAFCEDLALAKAQAAKDAYIAKQQVRSSLRRLISYHVAKNGKCWDHVIKPQPETINAAFQSFMDGIKKNNGLKRANLEKLFYPLGIPETHLDPTWIVQMDSFGNTRGGWAHSSVKTQQPPDPLSELQNVEYLLTGLKDLDKNIGRLS